MVAAAARLHRQLAASWQFRQIGSQAPALQPLAFHGIRHRPAAGRATGGGWTFPRVHEGIFQQTSFLANQFRVLMTAAAYVLMRELRLKARRTGCARAQVSTLRLRLLKLGAWIESSVRRIVIHLPIGTPFADDWRRIARSVGAVVT